MHPTKNNTNRLRSGSIIYLLEEILGLEVGYTTHQVARVTWSRGRIDLEWRRTP